MIRKVVVAIFLMTFITRLSAEESQGITNNVQPVNSVIYISYSMPIIPSVHQFSGNILGFGYEYQFSFISFKISASMWFRPVGNYMLTKISAFLHPFGLMQFDPYFGIGYGTMQYVASEHVYIDLPASIGLKYWFTRNIGIYIQDDVYLLSLNNFMTEIATGLIIGF